MRSFILAITLRAILGTHYEGNLVLALSVITGLFLSFGGPLSYGKLLLRGLSKGYIKMLSTYAGRLNGIYHSLHNCVS